MKKPHVLFVTEKYADGNPAWMSNSHHNLFGSLECSGLATHSNFFFEEHPHRLDDNLMRYHRRVSPDLTVVTILPCPAFGGNPSHQAFADLASRGPVVFVWFDTIHESIMNWANDLAQFSTLNVILDNPFFKEKDKFVALWTPQDTRIYRDQGLNRDIDVSFVGSIEGYADRQEYVNMLSASPFRFHRDGGQRERSLSPHDYAKIMQVSRISLSFSRTRNGLQQTKGRVWEVTLCGAMLMEDENPGTSLWFEPGKDYVTFNSRGDLMTKIEHYLNHPEQMAEIAGNGKKKAELYYSPKNWWTVVFNKCGVKLPQSDR